MFGWAWLRVRARGAGLLSEWWLLGITLLLFPVAIAMLTLNLLTRTDAGAPLTIFIVYLLGFVLLALGFVIGDRWRLAGLVVLLGWSVVAGLTLVPSTLSLALPVVALLSFPVLARLSPPKPSSERR